MGRSASPVRTTAWWRGAVGYQVYLRSFQDSDGDGLGDLAGLRRRLPYLADLGVNIVWVTPFYPSPQADHGYDVSDYTAVDPALGTLADVDAVLDDAHRLGLRVLVDLVPNHTSDQHPWFQDALGGRDAEHRDFYVWRDPAPDGGPPNNWVSNFGGPAWTLDAASGQYYMHLFLPEQPDLNWADPRVADEFDRILRFWLDRGVDGFRIDVAHSLVEDPRFRDNPLLGDPPSSTAGPEEVLDAFDHRYDMDQPGVLDVYRRWNDIAAEYDALLLGEVYLLDPDRLTRYVVGGDALHAAFCFAALRVAWDPDDIRQTLRAGVAAGEHGMTWPLSSHDDPRAATRFGGGALGARRALAYLTLLSALPGMPFVYQGDELGLDDGDIATAADPIAVRNDGAVGRDGARTPMVWEDAPGFGFTDGTPWLPFGDNRDGSATVAAQANDPASHLSRVRELFAVRGGLDGLQGVEMSWLTTDGPVVAFRRGPVAVACNTAAGPARLRLPATARVLFASAGAPEVHHGEVEVAPDAAVLLALDHTP